MKVQRVLIISISEASGRRVGGAVVVGRNAVIVEVCQSFLCFLIGVCVQQACRNPDFVYSFIPFEGEVASSA